MIDKKFQYIQGTPRLINESTVILLKALDMTFLNVSFHRLYTDTTIHLNKLRKAAWFEVLK